MLGEICASLNVWITFFSSSSLSPSLPPLSSEFLCGCISEDRISKDALKAINGWHLEIVEELP